MGWLVDSQDFSQVVRISRVEAIVTERREFVLYPLINGQPMKRSKMRRNVVPFKKLLEQGEQRCSEPPVVCLGDTEDSQKEESCSNQDVKEQRQRQESLQHL